MLPKLKKHCVVLARVDPEAELMLRVQRDEPGAFEELVARLGTRIFARFLRLLQDRQDAEDLTQEAFLRLYRCRKRYQPRARFSTWLFHITQNLARNAIRSRRRHARLRFTPLHGSEEEVQARGRGAEPPSWPVERLETAGIVRRAVGGLVGRQRRALEMHQFQHRSYAEIAVALSLSPKATKSLLYRARLQLRCSLNQFAEMV